MPKQNLHIGCLVRTKPYNELRKFGIKGPEKNIPYLQDVGIVVQILESHVVVLWQKLNKEARHFPHILEKISD